MPYSAIQARTSGATVTDLIMDEQTGGLCVSNFEENQINSGNSFFFGLSTLLDAAGSQQLVVETPDSTEYTHWKMQIGAGNLFTLKMVENITYTDGATITAYNSNRNSSATSGLLIKQMPSTYTVIGATFLELTCSGTVSGIPDMNKLILDANCNYVFEITSGADDNYITMYASWVEFTDLG